MEELKTASKCHICDQEFLNHHDLKAHFLECDMEHKCEICENVFQTATLLENHKNFHNEVNKKGRISLEMEYKDKIGEKPFGIKNKLMQNFVAVHEQKETIYNCSICTKKFKSQKILRFHLKIVHRGY